MAPNFFGTNGRETSSVKYFEIRLEESNLILRGSEDEASSVFLKGTVVLCLSEPLRIQGIRLRFTGEKRLGWYQNGGSGSNLVKVEDEFMRRVWEFQNNGKRSSEVLPPGNYEYPFDMILPGSTPESIEGLTDTWIVYRMKATIERGILQQNSIARKPVRIIRTLDTAALELAHAMSVENLWPEKVDYSLSTPTKAVIFGTTVQVNFRLIPLLKGLKFGKVMTELNEKQELSLKGQRVPIRCRQSTRSIAKDEFRLPEDAESENIEGQEGFMFSRVIRIPQSLKECLQTVDVLGVKIRHSLSFNVQMHNPDGHISELHATLPLYIFISPNMPIDDNHDLIDRGPQSMDAAAAAMEELTPPQYGEHQFDRLYSDIDQAAYMTPAAGPSGLNTPFTSRSRSASSDNLASLNRVASTDFAANILQSRLSNLEVPGPNRVVRDRVVDRSLLPTSDEGIEHNGNGPSGISCLTSVPGEVSFEADRGEGNPSTNHDGISSQVSEGDVETPGTVTPQHIEYSAESLAKVPSYTTALQSQTRRPVNDGLPTYQNATRPFTCSTMLQPQSQANIHGLTENHRDILRRCS